MGRQKTVEIAQILLVGNPKASLPLAGALWAAFDEVQRFYAPDDDWLEVPLFRGSTVEVRPSFTAHYVSWEVPPEVPAEAVIDDEEAIERILRESAGGPALFDHAVLGPLVHELVDPRGTSVVLTDLEILPPPEWRYMIWDAFPSGAVVSFAPLDPAYWATRGIGDRDQVATTKARARTACLTVVGSLLGIGRCRNERCIMLANVDSVLRLDDMVSLGAEHGIEALARRSFAGSDDPAEPESIVTTEVEV